MPDIVSQISGRTYVLESNDKHLQTIDFRFVDNICKISMMIDSIRYNYSFGSAQWIDGETTLHGPNLLIMAKAHFVGLPPAKVVGSYGWKDATTLDLVLRYIESPHTETITCKFNKNNLSVGFKYSNMPGYILPELKGVVRD
jgi:hypothetical protein